LGGPGRQALNGENFLGGKIGLDRQGVVGAVALEHGVGGGFHLVGLSLVVGTGAALGFAGIARQFYAVDGEHFAANESLSVADEQHFLEQGFDLGAEGADEGGEGGEVRGAVAGQGNEGDLFAAGGLNAAAVGEEDDLEQHGRRVGGSAGEVVFIAGVEAAEVDLVINEVVEGVLEGAGQKLPLKINGDKARVGVNVLVAGHRGSPVELPVGRLLFHLVHSRMRG
jgi:hypothetical protein